MSRLDEIEKRLQDIEKELGCERAKPEKAPGTGSNAPPALGLTRSTDWRSSPDLYRSPAPWETQPQWRELGDVNNGTR